MTTSSTTSVNKRLEAEGHIDVKSTVRIDDVDTAAQLIAGKHINFTPEEAARIRCVPDIVVHGHDDLAHAHNRRKIDWHLMPLMCSEHAFHRYTECYKLAQTL